MTLLLHAEGLGKRYGRHQALTECSLSIPQGRVVGLVGPNGAGKSTLLQLACGLIAPTSGSIEVLGTPPAVSAAQLARIGYVAQDTPVYAGLTVADHLRMGAHLNPGWDKRLAEKRIKQIGLDPSRKAGRLSGGQRAQLALTIAAAKRPELLIFDEPVAALDPLARRGFLQNLMEFVAELGASVVLSSHLIGDLERICDYLVVLAEARVQLAGEVDDLLSRHYRVTGARGALDELSGSVTILQTEHAGRQSTLVVRADEPLPQSASWEAEHLELEDMVLAYLSQAAAITGGYLPQQNSAVTEAQR